MITPELYMIGSHDRPRFYLCFDQTVFRIVVNNVLELYLEHLPTFDPSKKYPDVGETITQKDSIWSIFAYSKLSDLSMRSKKSMHLPDYLIEKWNLDLAGSTGTIESTKLRDNF